MTLRIGLLVLVTMLSSGCVLRYSQQEIDGTWYDDKLEKGWRPPVEVSLMTNDIPIGPSAVTLSLEFFQQELDVSAVPPMHDWQSISIRSTMVGGRFYPVRRGPILPYAGAGFGRTTLSADWVEYEGGFDPLFRCIAFCNTGTDMSGSLASGYHPYLAAGVELRPGFMPPALLFEYRRDFDRGDDFYQLSGRSFSLGLRFRID
ncbi:MAG: hypothetical protein OEO79_14915 [Gemmatimonadota bacterium]|nr:hypothetical protein [Gemmatimonadota bacterium]